MNNNTEKETPQLSYSELADLTHILQVEIFGFCTCEDGPKVYEDCIQDGEFPEYPKTKKAKDYTLKTYANGFGVWHSEIVFSGPMGNTGEAERIIFNAMSNAKKQIRKAITERMEPKKCKRLSYEVSANTVEPGIGRLTSLTIREK